MSISRILKIFYKNDKNYILKSSSGFSFFEKISITLSMSNFIIRRNKIYKVTKKALKGGDSLIVSPHTLITLMT